MQVEVKGFSKEGREKYIDNFICFHQKDSDKDGLVENESVGDGCGYDADDSGDDTEVDDSYNEEEDENVEYHDDFDDFVGWRPKHKIDYYEGNGYVEMLDSDDDVYKCNDYEDSEDSDDEDDDESLVKEFSTANFLNDLAKSPGFEILSYIPIVLSMLCLLWVSERKLPSGYTALFNEVIMHLAKHRYDKKSQKYLGTSSIVDWKEKVLISVGKVAIDGLFEDRLIFKASTFEKNELAEACSLGIVITERKRSRLDVTNTVSFIHKTFQEACAAFYWVELIERDREKFNYYLKHTQPFSSSMDYA